MAPNNDHRRRNHGRSLFTPKTPCFFKIILEDTVRDGKMRIPRKFVRRYGHGISSPVVLQDPSGAVWKVGLIKSEGCMWLQNGWKEFAEHYSIKYGHFVVFRYEGNCKFHVIIFDMSASEIEYPQTSNSHGEDCDQVEKFRQPKMEEAEDDISVEILREIPQSRKKRQKSPLPCSWPCKKVKTTLTNGITKSSNCSSSLAVKSRGKRVKPKKSLEADTKCDPHKLCAAKESMVLKTNENKNDAPIEILDDLPSQKTVQKSSLCSSRPRKKIRNNPCGNRESTSKLLPLPCHSRYKDTQSTRMKLEKSMKKECMDSSMKKYGGSLKFSTKDDGTRRKPTQRCKKAKVRPSSSQEERTKALFKFKNPFFRLVMQQSYISSDSLIIQQTFAKKYIGDKHGKVILCRPDLGAWIVKYVFRAKSSGLPKPKFYHGWKAFVKDNNLKVGDICYFELIKGIEPSFNVIIISADADEYIPLSSQANATEPNQVPFYKLLVPKIEFDQCCDFNTGNSDSDKQSMKQGFQPTEHKTEPSGLELSECEKTQKSAGLQAHPQSSSLLPSLPLEATENQTTKYSLKVVLKPYHIKHASVVLPSHVVEKFIKQKPKGWMVQVEDRVWHLKVIRTKSQTTLSAGFSAFVKDNSLKAGDTCIFEIVEESSATMKVSISRCSG
ncbi:hypothetical protein SLE2022_361810 [Rubroshorea leprosula]